MDESASAGTLPTLRLAGPWDWQAVITGPDWPAFAERLAEAIAAQRWFGAKTRAIRSLELVDAFAITPAVRLLLVRVHYEHGSPDVYQLLLGFADAEAAARHRAAGVEAWMEVDAGDRTLGLVYDALSDAEFCRQLLELVAAPRPLAGTSGELRISKTSRFEALHGGSADALTPRLAGVEQSNTSVVFGQRLIMKVYRRVEEGLNPEFEVSEHLTGQDFRGAPPLAGSLEYCTAAGQRSGLAMLQEFVPNQGDAWNYTLDWLTRLLSSPTAEGTSPPLPAGGVCRAAQLPVDPAARAALGEFLAAAERLGTRTAEIHLALASDTEDPAFAPQPLAEAQRRAYANRCAEEAAATFALLAQRAPSLSGRAAELARELSSLEPVASQWFAQLADTPIDVHLIRCHGDYHLGQVLRTSDDFVIIDFEGEPVRSIESRRAKQLALRDVAGMLRSLHYAACTAATTAEQNRPQHDQRLRAWTTAWHAWSGAAFLAAYQRTATDAVFLPASHDQFERLLDGCLLEKALYELRYELNNRPDWVYLPLAALVELLGPPAEPSGGQ